MASTYERSLIKGVIWETFSFLITLTAVYLVYGDFRLALRFNIVLTFIKMFFFFLHERVWKDVRWGKY